MTTSTSPRVWSDWAQRGPLGRLSYGGAGKLQTRGAPGKCRSQRPPSPRARMGHHVVVY